MKFNINDYKGKYVMHCKTEEETREFFDYLHSVGRKWYDGEAYSKKNIYWDWCKENTCYNFNDGYFDNKKHYLDKGYTILEWSDFKANEFTKADLKDGMVVECRNGNRYLVVGDRVLRPQGHVRLDEYTDHLKRGSYTIVKVYKPNKPIHFNVLFNDDFLTLIWERKEKPEPVEMTLEEVCKALGKEIKIVKG